MNDEDRPANPAAVKRMTRIFLVSSLLGLIVAFLNIASRSYMMRKEREAMRTEEALKQQPAPPVAPAP